MQFHPPMDINAHSWQCNTRQYHNSPPCVWLLEIIGTAGLQFYTVVYGVGPEWRVIAFRAEGIRGRGKAIRVAHTEALGDEIIFQEGKNLFQVYLWPPPPWTIFGAGGSSGAGLSRK